MSLGRGGGGESPYNTKTLSCAALWPHKQEWDAKYVEEEERMHPEKGLADCQYRSIGLWVLMSEISIGELTAVKDQLN